jgi:hypothetical protein
MTDRPDYIKCIQHSHTERKRTTWCGKSLSCFDWAFVDIDHAAYAAMSEARLVPCPECIAAIREVFKDV